MKKCNVLAFCLAVFVVWFAYWIIIMTGVFKGDFQRSGQFGDSFGGLNTLFTGLAFVVVLATLFQQGHQIEETKRDIDDGRRFRLKLDLFDRRYRVYEATVNFVGTVIGDLKTEGIDQNTMTRFDSARSEAYFLFAEETDLLKYLEELRTKSSDYANWRAQAKGKGPGSEESKKRDKIQDELYEALRNGARQRFMPHLSFPLAH
jgi:hypothetical protein